MQEVCNANDILMPVQIPEDKGTTYTQVDCNQTHIVNIEVPILPQNSDDMMNVNDGADTQEFSPTHEVNIEASLHSSRDIGEEYFLDMFSTA